MQHHGRLITSLLLVIIVGSLYITAEEIWHLRKNNEVNRTVISLYSKYATTTVRVVGSKSKAANKFPSTPAPVSNASPLVFSYAHGTVQADGKIFIGMADRDGNPFRTNEVVVFDDPNDLNHYKIVTIPMKGDIYAMVYDDKNDEIYFTLSHGGSFNLLRLDPKTLYPSVIIATTSIDMGNKPAIVTDGDYVYGITNTNPSTVFKVRVSDGAFTSSFSGHIMNGHSAAVGRFGSTTELYFGGGMADLFEKVDASDLSVTQRIAVPPCAISDDTPFVPMTDEYGYVFLGCEKTPVGYRIRTSDLTATQFDLPGYSFGMNVFDGNLYNAAQDGRIDRFDGIDIRKLTRFDTGTDFEINELFYAASTKSMYFTAWWGVKGLYEAELK